MTQETSQSPALLFDLDGTLIDSVYQHVLAWHEALEELGLSLAVWRIHRRIGMSGGLLVQALGREIGHRVLQNRHKNFRSDMPRFTNGIRQRSSLYRALANCCSN
jgi:beta-phosphoglucomutase-like phosphatase (HAD superfamily)